ncbi:hypothetical protein PHLCEN_2v11376 [Hermanssonia centrifuga]|uniref:Uncharacterized protein n=1 Tax=Hermanssonia centrifuga TaxID=98765 RepID=A0A2R6NKA3_9APHY|nr:hypothetical protein PHLCEN_2v11376 [Hermanssonia centrifuga]
MATTPATPDNVDNVDKKELVGAPRKPRGGHVSTSAVTSSPILESLIRKGLARPRRVPPSSPNVLTALVAQRKRSSSVPPVTPKPKRAIPGDQSVPEVAEEAGADLKGCAPLDVKPEPSVISTIKYGAVLKGRAPPGVKPCMLPTDVVTGKAGDDQKDSAPSKVKPCVLPSDVITGKAGDDQKDRAPPQVKPYVLPSLVQIPPRPSAPPRPGAGLKTLSQAQMERISANGALYTPKPRVPLHTIERSRTGLSARAPQIDSEVPNAPRKPRVNHIPDSPATPDPRARIEDLEKFQLCLSDAEEELEDSDSEVPNATRKPRVNRVPDSPATPGPRARIEDPEKFQLYTSDAEEEFEVAGILMEETEDEDGQQEENPDAKP